MGYQELPYEEDSFLGLGLVTLEFYQDGVLSGGEEDIGNNTVVRIEKDADEKRTLYSSRALNEVPIKEVQKRLSYKIAITNTDYNRRNLAMSLSGQDSDVAVTGASVTDEAATAKLDKWVKLAQRNIASSPADIVVTDDTGTTTYVKGTDYLVDYWTGRIKCLSSGDITEGQSLLVDYTYGDLDGFKIQGMKTTQFEARVRFTGTDLSHEKRSVELIAHKARLTTAKGLDLVVDDFGTLDFEGAILKTDDGYFDFYVFEEP